MRKATGGIFIEAPPDKVWETLADLSKAQDCFPGVFRSYYLSNERRGVGAARHCDIKSGLMKGYLKERITAWREGESFSLELYDGKGVPYRTMEADFRIEPQGEGTLYTQTIRFAMKGGPLAPALGLVGALAMKKQMPKMLQGVKRCVENHPRRMAQP